MASPQSPVFRCVQNSLLVVLLPLGGSAAAPLNNNLANATLLSGPSVVTNGSNAAATKETGEPWHAGDAGGRSVWWSWTAPFTGSWIVRTTGSSFDTLLAVYTGDSVSALTLVAANDQDLLDPLGGDNSRVKFNASSGTSYHIAVDGFGGASGSIVLTIESPPRPANDNFVARAPLFGSTLRAEAISLEATKEEGEPDHAGEPGGKSVWWSWTVPSTGPATVWTLGSDFDTVLAVYSGESVDDLTLLAANDQDPLGGDTSRVSFNGQAGARYEIAVDGWNAGSGRIVLRLDQSPPPALSQARVLMNGAFQAILRGAAGRTYVVEAKPNLAANCWLALATNTISPAGTWTFVDPSAIGLSHRFYRARLQE